MGFPASVADDVLVRCNRHCCLCGKYVGQKIELHHIKQVADGGEDTVDNCIPLCFNCHAEVKAYNPRHPKGRKFTENELKGHRDKCYKRYSLKNTESPTVKVERIFRPRAKKSLIYWGYPEQDQICPVVPGNMVLVAGCSGAKKSMYLHHIVNKNILSGCRVVYGCLKDKPFDVGIEIVGENAHVNVEHIKRGMATEDDWEKLANSKVASNAENLALIPYSEISNWHKILDVVENSGADIVVIDDFNGILFENGESVEHFLYELRNVAAQTETVVFVIYNLDIQRRPDKRPMLNDFPSDSYYRLFDIIQFLYKPDLFYADEDDKRKLEVIIVKGALNVPYTVNLLVLDENISIFPVDDKKYW